MPVESAVQAVLDHLAEGQPKFAQYRPADFIDARVLSEIDKAAISTNSTALMESKDASSGLM